MNEERRKDLVKVVKKKGEESKIAIRAIRRDANEQIKKDEKDKLITEDDRKELDERVQKMTDDLMKEIDNILAAKEKEILSV
jgi:ribosome recycling factor